MCLSKNLCSKIPKWVNNIPCLWNTCHRKYSSNDAYRKANSNSEDSKRNNFSVHGVEMQSMYQRFDDAHSLNNEYD